MAKIAELAVNLVANVSGFNRTMQQVARDTKRTAATFRDFGKSMAKIGAPFAAFGSLSVKAASDFETAFAGVRKTVNASPAEFEKLRKGILDMSSALPASASEIARVGEAAGQLGIKTENILGFSKTMIDLGESTNLSADEAATALARLANITGLPQDQFDKLGSAIVGLGNNFATTEREIVEMSTRLAAAGTIAGLKEPDILGFAAALSSVGINAEAGGTALSRVFKDITVAVELGGDKLQKFAEVAGQSSAEFKQSFEEDAGKAIVSFIEGLKRIDNEGGSMIQTLAGLKLENIRVSNALLSLANAGDLAARAIAQGRKDFEENIALTEEANKRYETFASRVKILWNNLTNLAIVIGDEILPTLKVLVDGASSLILKFSALEPETKKFFAVMTVLVPAISGAALAVGVLVSAIGGLVPLLVGTGLVGAVSALTAGWIAWGDEISNFIGRAIPDMQIFREEIDLIKGAWEICGDVFSFVGDAILEKLSFLVADFKELGLTAEQTTRAIVNGFNVIIPGIKRTYEQMKLVEKAQEMQREHTELQTQAWDHLIKKMGGVDKIKDTYKKAVSGAQDYLLKLTGLEKQTDKVTKSTKNHVGANELDEKALKKARDAAERKAEALKKLQDRLRDLERETEQSKIRENLERALEAGNTDLAEDLRKQLYNSVYAGTLEGLEDSIAAAGNTPEAQQYADDIATQTADGVIEGIEKGVDKSDPSIQKFADGFSEVGNVLSNVVSLFAADTAQLISGLSSTIGAGIGFALGGPEGGAAGAQIGQTLGTIINSVRDVFGGGSAASEAKKAVDKWFADLFDHNRLTVIINGQLALIDDLQFSGWPKFGEEDADQFGYTLFEGLDFAAKSFFTAVADGFTQMLDSGDYSSDELARVFANNLGGSLNNLQLLVQASGKSLEDFKGAITEAFLAGSTSAIETVDAFRNLEEIFTVGIPGAIGDVVQAMENLIASGGRGRASVDALVDIFAEARERGITSFEELRQYLLDLGYSAEDVELIFSKLAEQGITTFDQILNASMDQLIQIMAGLEAGGFGFAEALKDAGQQIDEINKRLEEVPDKLRTNWEINIETTGDTDVLDALPSQSGNIFSNGKVIPSAKGNIFANGGILPFAKGGIVREPALFDIGSIAEVAPEIIMPAQRMSGGDFGVKVQLPEDIRGGDNINISITTRGGRNEAEEIKREIENYFDRRNRAPGRRI